MRRQQWYWKLMKGLGKKAYMIVIVLSVCRLVRDSHWVFESLAEQDHVHVPESGALSHAHPPRVLLLEVIAPRRDLQPHNTGDQESSVKRVMEIRSRIKDTFDDTPPPRESWSYAAPGRRKEECEPMKGWQTMSYPTCNDMHSFSLFDKVRYGQRNETNVVQVGHKPPRGVARRNWMIPSKTNNGDDHLVLKNLKIGTSFNETNYERQRLDALAMEILTWSSHVTNIYGHCGLASITEYADGGTLEDLLKKSEITPRERLVHAVDLAQAVADLHNVDRDWVPSMVHRDLDVDNIVIVKGKLKLNDFSLAHFMRRNKDTNSTCAFQQETKGLRSGYHDANARSPEELLGDLLSEKVDVFGLGALLFYMLTASQMYYCEGGEYCFIRNMLGNEAIRRLKVDGVAPALPAHISHSSDPETAAIVNVMRQSITSNASARPTAQNIADALKHSLLENERTTLYCPTFQGREKKGEGSRVYLAGLIRDASSISTELFHKLVELNCNHGFGIHIVAESGKDQAIAQYEERKVQQYSNKTGETCAPFVIIHEPEDLKTSSNTANRVDQIAFLRDFQRERLQLAFIRRPTDNDIVILVDFDLFRIPPVDVITQETCNMIHQRDHDVVCATGLMHRPYGYYDTFATILKPDTWVYPMSGRLKGSRRGENLNLVRSDDMYGTVTQEHILAYFENNKHQTSHGAVPVRSCFGGLAFYRASKWFTPQCRYSQDSQHLKEYSNKEDGRPCEHVVFHLCLSKHDPSTNVVVQPRLRTFWDEPMDVQNRLVSGKGVRGGLVTVSKRAAEGARLVNGQHSLRINEAGKLVIERHINEVASEIIWTANANAKYFHDKWSTMFFTLEKNGLLQLVQQVQQVRKDLPAGECKLTDASATSCRVEIWSSEAVGPIGQYFLVLANDGTLRVIDNMQKVLWANDGGLYNGEDRKR